MTTSDGNVNTFYHWVQTPYSNSGTWCGRESLTHAPNLYVPCAPAVVVFPSHFTTNANWQAVWTTVRDVSFNLRDWRSGTPMMKLTETTEVPGKGFLSLSSGDLGWCSGCNNKLGTASVQPAVSSQGITPSTGVAIFRSSVTINANSQIPWDANAGRLQPASNEVSLGTVVMHELMHGLGIAHPTAGPRAGNLMACVLGYGETYFPTMDQDSGDTLSWSYAKPWNQYSQPGGVKAC